MPDLTIHSEPSSTGHVVTTVIGEIDDATIDQFRLTARIDERATDLFDLRFVSFMSAAGVSALREADRTHPCEVLASSAVARVLALCDSADLISDVEPTAAPQLQGAGFGVAVHDADLRFIHVNEAMARINGVPASAHDGRHPTELFDLLEDDLTAGMTHVRDHGGEWDMTVEGNTPSTIGGRWRCRFRASRYPVVGPVVIATVETIEPPLSSIAPADDITRIDIVAT